MPANTAPTSLNVLTYNVGFGDCFLLSFGYAQGKDKHVLIDFGSMRLPGGAGQARMKAIGQDIATRTSGKLTAVVATHRHKDHISGFDPGAGGKGPGGIIRRLKPDLVVQPWTEDPKIAKNATGPALRAATKSVRHVAGLSAMNAIASQAFAAAKSARHWPHALRETRKQLSFIGEDNIKNAAAVKNLMTMAPNEYLYAGQKSKLSRLLPGVEVFVLGPPTVKQSDKVKNQKREDRDEFWHFQARAADALRSHGPKRRSLFAKYVRSTGPSFPVASRWLMYHARTAYGKQMLQIVRTLDKAMNNTSLILCFKVGQNVVLFPGDAQIENWLFSLQDPKLKPLLAATSFYKVGHHGSLNATPKSLWARLKNRSRTKTKGRLKSVISTLDGVHGSEDSKTEVPRRTLVAALKRETDHYSTQDMAAGELGIPVKVF